VSASLQAGFKVTAITRNPEKFTLSDPNLTVVQGDVTNQDSLEKAFAGQDAVFSAFGPTDMSKPLTDVSDAIKIILNAMRKTGVKRYIGANGAGLLDVDANGTTYRQTPDFPSAPEHVALDHARAWKILVNEASDINWTLTCPHWIIAEPATGKVTLYDESISLDLVDPNFKELPPVNAGDIGQFYVTEVVKNEHIGKRVGIFSSQ